MKRVQPIDPRVDRFLDEAAALTVEQWTAIYWRYVEAPKILKAARKFITIADQAFLDRFKLKPIEERGGRDPVVMEINARVERIVAPLPEVELDTERGGYLRHRVSWLIVQTNLALENAELLSGDPACLKAVKAFLTLYEGVIEFQEFA